MKRALDPVLIIGGMACAIWGFCILTVEVAIPASMQVWGAVGPPLHQAIGDPPLWVVGVVLFIGGCAMLVFAE